MPTTYDRVVRSSVMKTRRIGLINYFPIEVLFGGAGRHFHSKNQHSTSKIYYNIILLNLAFDRVTRQSVLITHSIVLTKTFLTSVIE